MTMSDNAPDLPVISSARQIRWQPSRRLVPVPEWGGQFWVQELTAEEKDEMNSFLFEVDGNDYTLNLANQTVRLVVFSTRDESGNRIWPNTQRGVAEVAKLGSAGAERIAEVARELSKLTKESKKAVAGKSAPAPMSSSNSISPPTSDSLPAAPFSVS